MSELRRIITRELYARIVFPMLLRINYAGKSVARNMEEVCVASLIVICSYENENCTEYVRQS